VDALCQLPERNRFMKGLYSWVGFRQASIEIVRAPRAAGTSKWRYWRLWNFALDGITAFSTMPLRIWSYVGALISAAAFAYALYLIVRTILHRRGRARLRLAHGRRPLHGRRQPDEPRTSSANIWDARIPR